MKRYKYLGWLSDNNYVVREHLEGTLIELEEGDYIITNDMLWEILGILKLDPFLDCYSDKAFKVIMDVLKIKEPPEVKDGKNESVDRNY